MRKIVGFLICILLCKADIFAQSIRYNCSRFSYWSGSALVTDAKALSGQALVRYSSSPNETAWYGPYLPLQAGTYQVQFRLKVTDNTRTDALVKIDVWSNGTGVLYDSRTITPSMFTRSNEWQTFTLDVLAPVTAPDIEIRGMEFKTGITDLFLDYVNVIKTQDFFATVLSSGNVGINTTTPKELLSVNGTVLAKKVKVSVTDLPDYVFDEDYQLRTLPEVADYIKQNHHLPEVPSAAEVKKDGLDLGDNQATLLKKIEELTLYAIEQNKKLEAQQQQLKEQQAMILKLNRVVGNKQRINKLQKQVKK